MPSPMDHCEDGWAYENEAPGTGLSAYSPLSSPHSCWNTAELVVGTQKSSSD